MNEREWDAVVELLARARSLPPAEREGFLEGLEVAPAILREVRRLLEEEPAPGFLEPPAGGGLDALFGIGLEGAELGGYVLERLLGRGAIGVVYLARQAKLERHVALKILPLAAQGKSDALERFRREARAAGHLDHPNLVSVLDFGEEAGAVWYTMRFVDGHDLSVEVENQRHARASRSASAPQDEQQKEILLPSFEDQSYIENLVERFVDLARAVHHAHERGVVHRDIKPQNVLVDRAGKLHLADFGLARDARYGTLSLSGEIRGTPSYMSPEQARASRTQVDHRTDVYSLSVVLYELLALRAPHLGETVEEVLMRILTETPPPLRRLSPRVPKELELITAMGMEKDLERRYSSARSLADDLERFVRHEPIQARAVPLGLRLRRWSVRHRMLVAVSVTVLVALGLGIRLAAMLGSPRIHVSIVSDLPGDAVFLQRIDAVTGRLAEREQLGKTPLDALRLAPGYYRFTVVRPAFGWAELSRLLLQDGEQYDLRARVLSVVPDELDMVGVASGDTKVGFDGMFRQYALRTETLPAFWIDRYEVTNGDYRTFLDSLGSDKRARYEPAHWHEVWWVQNWQPAWEGLPVVGVLYEGAQAYAEWAGKRLPTYAEWERSTRGVEGHRYPWGADEANLASRAVYDRPRRASSPAQPEPPSDWWGDYLATVYPARSLTLAGETLADINDLGLFHTLGNVQEWTETLEVDWIDGDPFPNYADRVAKGGDWNTNFGDLGLAGVSAQPAALAKQVGFRCAKSALDTEPR